MLFDRKHSIRTEISKISLQKAFYYNNNYTENKKVKDFKKLSNK